MSNILIRPPKLATTWVTIRSRIRDMILQESEDPVAKFIDVSIRETPRIVAASSSQGGVH